MRLEVRLEVRLVMRLEVRLLMRLLMRLLVRLLMRRATTCGALCARGRVGVGGSGGCICMRGLATSNLADLPIGHVNHLIGRRRIGRRRRQPSVCRARWPDGVGAAIVVVEPPPSARRHDRRPNGTARVASSAIPATGMDIGPFALGSVRGRVGGRVGGRVLFVRAAAVTPPTGLA